MISNILILAIYTALCVFVFEQVSKEGDKFKFPTKVFAAALVLCLVVRLVFAAAPYSFTYDIQCFKAWSDYTTVYGFDKLYSQDVFLDYPPGYMYVLFLLRSAASLLGVDINGGLYTMMIKLPSIIADFGCGYLVYKISRENLNSAQSKLLTVAFLSCPAIIYNSSVWGQIDSFYIFFAVLAIYLAYKNKTVPAAAAYAYALLVKPQALLFGPILLFYIIERKSVKELFKAIATGLGSLYLLLLPFCPNMFDLSWVLTLYKNTFGGHKYFTINAYNLYAILGLNWVDLSSSRSAWMINVAVISVLVLFVGFAFLKLKDRAKFFYLAGFIALGVFCFATMMHERYVHPVIIFGVIAAALTKSKVVFYLFLMVSGINYINSVAVMRSYFNDGTQPAFLVAILAIGIIACFGVSLWMVIKELKKNDAFNFTAKTKRGMAVALVTAVYGGFALFNLGSRTAPQSYFMSDVDNMSFDIQLQEPSKVKSVYTYAGIGDEFSGERVKKATSMFDIYYSQDGVNFQLLVTLGGRDVFQWKQEICDVVATNIRVVATNPSQVLSEIILVGENGKILTGQAQNYNVSADYPAVNALDEADCIPEDLSYYSSAYFDEIYHARTGYEQINGYSIYETTHPPLGKILIGIGIKLFGMTPFGWRIVGAVCGIAMLPIFYLLASGIFKSFFAAFSATCLLAVDFMHITQTRISTVDTYVVLFTMLTFLFMLYYHKSEFTGSIKKQFLYLGLSGASMACAVSSKWNGAYAMVGLAVFFFISLYQKYKGSEKDAHCKKRVAATILFCFLAFVALPIAIYVATFIPVVHTTGLVAYIEEVWRWQVNMYNYHSTLVAEHFFSSLWYTWPFTIKPIWYSITMLSGGMASSISAFGNPLIWWLTPFAAVGTVGLAWKKKDTGLWLIVLGFVFSLLPWVFVTRLSFIYHYFPTAIFGILAIGAIIDYLSRAFPKSKKYIVMYLIACLGLFLIFLPVTTGVAVQEGYLEWLEWFPTWNFINTN